MATTYEYPVFDKFLTVEVQGGEGTNEVFALLPGDSITIEAKPAKSAYDYLLDLGNSPSEVAENLTRAGIALNTGDLRKGSRSSVCPVARYLSRGMGAPWMVDYAGARPKAAVNHNAPYPPYTDSANVKLPTPVMEFIQVFDTIDSQREFTHDTIPASDYTASGYMALDQKES